MQPIHATTQVFAAPNPPRESNSASIAAWILLVLACIGACIPGLGFGVWIIIVPILLITLILGIIAISKGSTWNGVWIILASLIVVPAFVVLAPIVSTALAIGAAQDSSNASSDASPSSVTTIQKPEATNAISTLPQATAQSAEITGMTVSSVDLGSAVGANNAITVPAMSFDPMDTIHASVATAGSGGMLGVKWTYQDGQIVDTQDKEVAAGSQTTDFSIRKPDGWPLGRYHLEVTQDGRLAAGRDFAVTHVTESSHAPSQESDASGGSDYADSLGVSYRYERNANGAVLRSSAATIYLGKNCDAASPEHGNGSWAWANGGFKITFQDGTELGFPRQEIDAGNEANCQM